MSDLGIVGSASVTIDPDFTGFAESVRSKLLPILQQVASSVKSIDVSVKDLTKSLQASVPPAESLNAALDGVDSGDLTAVAGAAQTAASALADTAISAEATNAALDAIDPNDLIQVSAAADTASGSLVATSASAKTTEGSLISLGTVAKGLAIGAAIGGAAVLGLGAAGIKTAGDMEQTRIAFQGLFGSTEKADAFIKKLQDFAATTPFEFDQVTKATQKLISLGQTGDEAIKTLTTIGNAAAAVGAPAESIDRVVLALSQIQAKGKLSAEELNQIAEALPNFNRGAFLDKLAAQLGKTREQVAKLADEGKITAKQAMPALMSSLEGATGALGAMDRQSKTLLGQLSTFKDVVKNKMIDAFTPLLPVIQSTLEPLGETISTVFTSIAPLFEALVKLIGPLVTALTPIFNTLATTLAPVITALTPFLVKFAEVLAGGLVTFLQQMGPALVAIAEALGPILPAIADLAAALLNSLAPVIADLVKNGFIPLVQQLLPPLIQMFSDPVFLDAVKQLASAFTDIVKALVDSGLLKAFTDLIVQLGLPAIGLFRDAIIAIRDVMQSEDFKTGIMTIKNAIQTTFGKDDPSQGGSILADWHRSFNETIEDFKHGLAGAQSPTDAFHDGLDKIGKVGSWLKDEILDPIGGVLQTVWDKLTGIADFIRGDGTDAWTAFGDGLRFIKDEILDPIGGILEDIVGWLGTAIDKIEKFGAAIPDWLKKVGGEGGISVPGFAKGGVVPGPVGAPVMAVVHGGETIIPPGLLDGASGGSSQPFMGSVPAGGGGGPVQIFVTVPAGTANPQAFGAAVGSAAGDAFVAKTNMKVAVRTSPSSAR